MNLLAQEDYLKSIYKLSKSSGTAATGELAEFLGIKPASVTNMLKKLSTSSPPLVQYQKHKGASLTDEGRRMALKVIRDHRLIEMYLYTKLGFNWDEVHDEAELLEHAVTQEFVNRLSEILGHPQYNPHGQNIPSIELEMVDSTAVPLTQFMAGETAVIHHILDDNSEHLRIIKSLDLLPKTLIQIKNILEKDLSIQLRIIGQTNLIDINSDIAKSIFAEGVNSDI